MQQEQLRIYEGIRMGRSNDVERWMEFVAQAMRDGHGNNFSRLLGFSDRRGIVFPPDSAIKLIEEDMECAGFTGIGDIQLCGQENFLLQHYRSDPMILKPPRICELGFKDMPCNCFSNSEFRCPLLYGRGLELVQTEEGVKFVAGRPYGSVNLVLGDGNGVETLGLAKKRPDEAIVVVDPLVNALYEIVGNPSRTRIKDVLREYYSIDVTEFRPEDFQYLLQLYSGRINLGNINVVRNGFQSLEKFTPNGFFDNVFFSFPYPRDNELIGRRLPGILTKVLARGGSFVFRSEKIEIIEGMKLSLEGSQGFGNIEIADNYSYPVTLYDIYFKGRNMESYTLNAVRR